MTIYQKAYLFVFLAMGLLVAGLLIYQSERSDTKAAGDFRVRRDWQIVRIELKDNDHLVNIQQHYGRGWLINDQYEANQAAVNDLLATLRNLFVRFPVPYANQSEVIENLQAEGIRVVVYVRAYWIPLPGTGGLFPRQRRVRSLLVGKDTPDEESTYMMMAETQMPYVIQVPGLAGGLREVFLPMEHLWRDPVLINLQASQIREVRVNWPQQHGESFIISQQDGQLMLKGDSLVPDQRINQARLENYLNGFTDLYYEQLITGGSQQMHDSLRFPQPFMLLEVIDKQQDTLALSFFRRIPLDRPSWQQTQASFDPDRFYVKIASEAMALGQYFVFNRVMRPLSFFLEEQPDEGSLRD